MRSLVFPLLELRPIGMIRPRMRVHVAARTALATADQCDHAESSYVVNMIWRGIAELIACRQRAIATGFREIAIAHVKSTHAQNAVTATAMIAAILTTVLAAVLPARQAARLNPVEVIR